ncbi:unnamed protein product [Penicillium salamii]|uniref:Uncharacterized protein n=1 Tax=Penicillium salamii TaxID=1612424 RepID=A0A9W4JTP3_9EURO|nr:unnamed protein product [Penicillium salamii]
MNSESYREPDGKQSKGTLEPTVLFLSGHSVLDEAATSTPLYQVNCDITSISNKDSSLVFERVDHKVPELELEDVDVTAGTSRKRPIFYLAHPMNAQYRTDIPARYYITAALPEMVGNIRLDTSGTRFHKVSFKAMLSSGKTASHQPLFDEVTQQLLFDIQPQWKLGRSCYKWSDCVGKQLAVEEHMGDIYKLSITTHLEQSLRDALVAVWLLRLWHDTAESKQAKKECESSRAPLSPICYSILWPLP